MMKTFATKTALAVGVATVAMTAVSAPAEAFTVFTDRTAWQNAITGANPIVTETFDSLPLGPSPSVNVTTPSGINVTGNFVFVGPNGSSPTDRILSVTLQETVFNLPNPSIAFGVDLRDQSDTQGSQSFIWRTFDSSGAETGSDTFTFADSPAFSFFGIVQEASDPLIASIRFNDVSGQAATLVSYNNASFATPIPTPALLPGLIGMGVAAWRKRQGAAAGTEA